jgi:plastocyanin
MRRAVVLAVAAAVLLVPAAPSADAAKGRKHRVAKKRHYKDERVVMPARRPARKPPRKPPAERPPVTPPEPKPLTRIQVIAREFSLTLSRQTVAAGTVAVELNNRGEDPHDLRVERAESALAGFNFSVTEPGAVATQKLQLGPGAWRLYCTLDGHAALGMSATVTVAG